MVENKYCFYEDSDDDPSEGRDSSRIGQQQDTPPPQGEELPQDRESPTIPDEEENVEELLVKKITKASGIASAILGFLIGGPVVALLAGFGSAHAATQEGPIGDIARALGELAIEAKKKWHEVDAKHDIMELSKAAAKQAFKTAVDLDRRYQIFQNLKRNLILGFNMTLEWIQRHQLVERGIRSFHRGLAYVTEQLSDETTSRRRRPSEYAANTGNAEAAQRRQGRSQF